MGEGAAERDDAAVGADAGGGGTTGACVREDDEDDEVAAGVGRGRETCCSVLAAGFAAPFALEMELEDPVRDTGVGLGVLDFWLSLAAGAAAALVSTACGFC